jgi:hypothetical protein
MAQTTGDLNSLVLQASRYIAFETAGQAQNPQLALYRIIGTSGGSEESLMQGGVDIQLWTLVYQVEPAQAPPPLQPAGIALSASVRCIRGMFNALVWSPLPVFDAKSLQWAWIAISLDDAIAELKSRGFTRGFSNLTVMRPMHPHYSDECTFVFKCPLDHAYVGISAQTGRGLWTEPIPF